MLEELTKVLLHQFSDLCWKRFTIEENRLHMKMTFFLKLLLRLKICVHPYATFLTSGPSQYSTPKEK
jgi:hypothetical protein